MDKRDEFIKRIEYTPLESPDGMEEILLNSELNGNLFGNNGVAKIEKEPVKKPTKKSKTLPSREPRNVQEQYPFSLEERLDEQEANNYFRVEEDLTI